MGSSILLEGPWRRKVRNRQRLGNEVWHGPEDLIQVNLSEQTELADLVGQDLSSHHQCERGSTFRWMDGPLLTAIKRGCWFLLDELNLAPQPVLKVGMLCWMITVSCSSLS
jgi:midasin (ATPase involved in ribosome maturation)